MSDVDDIDDLLDDLDDVLERSGGSLISRSVAPVGAAAKPVVPSPPVPAAHPHIPMQASSSSHSKPRARVQPFARDASDDELDDLAASLDSLVGVGVGVGVGVDSGPFNSSATNKDNGTEAKKPDVAATASATTTCYSIQLSNLAHMGCARLRCTSCDHIVLKIPGNRWSDSADYMFFRNNVPDLTKLSERLKPRSGWSAYACQCSWLSTDRTVQLSMLSASSSAHKGALPGTPLSKLRWVCAGH